MTFTAGCPVCSVGVYTDPAAPMARTGSINPERHSCVDNDTWRQRNRFGGSVTRLRQRLMESPDELLAGWPRVAELKARALDGQKLN